MPMASANSFSLLRDYNSEDTVPPELGSGERLNENGYITNAPLELGDEDYIHRITPSGGNKQSLNIVLDELWKSKCPMVMVGGYGQNGDAINGYWYYTAKQLGERIDIESNGFGNNKCDEAGNHYWIDETKGPFSQGCGDVDAANYTSSVDYVNNSLCLYECSDLNRISNSDGSCGNSCNEGYGLNDDGVCEAGLSTKLSDSMRNLPYGLIGGSIALLVGAKYLLSKRG